MRLERQLHISIQCKGHEGIKRKTIKEKMANFSDTPVLSLVHVQQIQNILLNGIVSVLLIQQSYFGTSITG